MQVIISFIMSHEVAFSMLAIALIDFAMAMSPKLESNGILHMIKNILSGKKDS